jgi:hypothetical protein
VTVASRVSGPAYNNIKSWFTPVIESKEGGLGNGRRSWMFYDASMVWLTNARLRSGRWQRYNQKNLPFVQFLAKFNTLLADLNWDSVAKVSTLKARIGYELSQALVFIIDTPQYDDYDGWVKLLVRLVENAEAHNVPN